MEGQGRDKRSAAAVRRWHGERVEPEDVGSRIRQVRKLRGLTQQQLAAGTHFSLSLIKKVEAGTVPASPALVAEVARVLTIRPAYLYGFEARELADQPRVEAAGIAALRTALDAYDDPQPEGDPWTLELAERRVEGVGRLIYRLRYDEAAVALPAILHQLYALAAATGDVGDKARAVLHDAYRLSASVAGQYRQADLAAICAERHVYLAPLTGDPVRVAISAYHRSTRHLQSGDFALGLRLLDRAGETIEPTPPGRAVAVQLWLRSAILAARSGDPNMADEYVLAARRMVEDVRPPARPYYNIDAGALNVTIHWCAVPVENYDGATAVHRASRVRIGDSARPERVAHHYVDQARAWLLHGDRQQTIDSLNRARRIAPNRVRFHPTFRSTILSLATSDRSATGSLADLARWASIAI
jgi:transcriptional regulator with XRE-family HTH domain